VDAVYSILISDKLGKAGLARLAEADDVAYEMKTTLSKDELVAAIGGYDALIVRSGTQVDADVLKAGGKLKVVGRAGAGVDNIDVEAATLQGIVVMNTPGANSVATAEQTLALMLAVSRHTAQAHASLLAGEWQRSRFTGRELFGKVLGIIGLGRVGRLVATRAQAFGMEVIAFDPYVAQEEGAEAGVRIVDLATLYGRADYVTLHAVATTETRQMIDAAALAQMKEGAILINVARGDLLDAAAVRDALEAGKLRAVAVDVYSEEPPPADHPLLGRADVLHTPHLGASTVEAQENVATQIVDQVLAALRGQGVRNAVNDVDLG
jgi:D-3-phosphoglycerate dehydrogenase